MEAFVDGRRRPAETPRYRLLESLYERLKGCRYYGASSNVLRRCWEERFEHRFGFGAVSLTAWPATSTYGILDPGFP